MYFDIYSISIGIMSIAYKSNTLLIFNALLLYSVPIYIRFVVNSQVILVLE